jgi:hypothetical protein
MYLEGEGDPMFAGTEDLVSGDEVEALLGVVAKRLEPSCTNCRLV